MIQSKKCKQSICLFPNKFIWCIYNQLYKSILCDMMYAVYILYLKNCKIAYLGNNVEILPALMYNFSVNM